MCRYCSLTLSTKAFTEGMRLAIRQVKRFSREVTAMPNSPPSVCSTPGCGGRRTNGVCDRGCNRTKNGTARRNTTWVSSPLYHSQRWKDRSQQHRDASPTCVMCKAEGRVVPATVADHIEPWRTEDEFWSNELQSLCDTHHGRKSASERQMVKCSP